MTMPLNLTPARNTEEVKAKGKVNLKAERERDIKPVRGIFRNHETPGGVLRFVFKKYREDKVEKYELLDGNAYELPLMVAKHITNNCGTPEYQYVQGDEFSHLGFGTDGMTQMRIVRNIKRFSFDSLEFTNFSDLNFKSDIVGVEFNAK